MIPTSTRLGRTAAWIACLALGFGAAAQAGTVDVYSNNPSGDAYNVNLGGGAANRRGEAVGSTGWYYNSVGGNATIGIASPPPSWVAHSGNGSVLFHGVDGDSKADIEFFKSAALDANGNYIPTSALGQLKDLTTFSYDWYRDSANSTSNTILMPSLRLQITDGVHSGYLVFEQTYNQGPGPVPANQWVTTDILNSDLIMWSNGTLPNSFTYATTLSEWMATSGATTSLGDYYVVGVSSGIGSGWSGTFTGGVDNITFGFNGQNTTYNFETGAVPEPASVVSMLIAGGLGVAGAAYRRRRAR